LFFKIIKRANVKDVGCVVGIVSMMLVAQLMGVDHILISSLATKSATTPIAISLSKKNGGIPALTAAFVVICGIFGGLVGPIVLRKIGIKSKIAQALAMSSASHAIGTARAMEMGAVEGAISFGNWYYGNYDCFISALC
jgi:putative effector of murein hydrolase